MPVDATSGRHARIRNGIVVIAEVVTWDLCVIRVEVAGTSFVVCLPGSEYETWMERFDSGALDEELSRVALAPPTRSLRSVPRSVRRAQLDRPPRVGIEHEFEVVLAGRSIDFGVLLPTLLTDHIRADPADPLATRFSWGVLTADGREAEVATSPIELGAGFVQRALDACAEAHAALRAHCPADHDLIGFSTHISVAWPARHDARRARAWAQTFAPAMMLLLDLPTSSGMLVRPRPGRLELCGDFCTGSRLAAALGFAAASVKTLVCSPPRALRRWSVDVTLQPAVQRYGWYVDRRAFGMDLYAEPHAAMLRRRNGSVSAGEHLRDMIRLVSAGLGQIGGPDDVLALERVLSGGVSLPLLPAGAPS